MTIDIITLTAKQYAALSAEQLDKVRAAQLKKDGYKAALGGNLPFVRVRKTVRGAYGGIRRKNGGGAAGVVVLPAIRGEARNERRNERGLCGLFAFGDGTRTGGEKLLPCEIYERFGKVRRV